MKFSTSSVLGCSWQARANKTQRISQAQPRTREYPGLSHSSQYCNLILTRRVWPWPCTPEYGCCWYSGNSPPVVFSVILDDEAHWALETKWRRFREKLQHFHNIQYRSGARKWQQLLPASISQNEEIQEKEKITLKIINHLLFEYRWATNLITDLVHPSLSQWN